VLNILSSYSIVHKQPLCYVCFFPIFFFYIGLHLVVRQLWLGLDYSVANIFPVISYRLDIFVVGHRFSGVSLYFSLLSPRALTCRGLSGELLVVHRIRLCLEGRNLEFLFSPCSRR